MLFLSLPLPLLATLGAEPTPPAPADHGPSEAAVLHPDLADAAPVPDWAFEGAPAQARGEYDDTLDKKVRRAAVTTVAGGSVALLGVVGAITGGVLFATPRTTHAAPLVMYASAGVAGTGIVVALLGRRRLARLREQRRTQLAFGVMPMRTSVHAQLAVRF